MFRWQRRATYDDKVEPTRVVCLHDAPASLAGDDDLIDRTVRNILAENGFALSGPMTVRKTENADGSWRIWTETRVMSRR